MLTAFQQRGRVWMYKVEPEAMASGVHGFSEIIHLVFCEWGIFWEGQGRYYFLWILKGMCGPRKLSSVNVLTLVILKTTLGRR